MPAPFARSSTEMADNGRSSRSRSHVARIASSRSSPEGREARRLRARGGRATPRAPYRREGGGLNMLLTRSTDCRYGASVAAQPEHVLSEHVDVLIVGAGLSGI